MSLMLASLVCRAVRVHGALSRRLCGVMPESRDDRASARGCTTASTGLSPASYSRRTEGQDEGRRQEKTGEIYFFLCRVLTALTL